MKEGGGPDSERDVPIFFCPKLGGEGGGQITLGQIPKIFTLFFLKASLRGPLGSGSVAWVLVLREKGEK